MSPTVNDAARDGMLAEIDRRYPNLRRAAE